MTLRDPRARFAICAPSAFDTRVSQNARREGTGERPRMPSRERLRCCCRRRRTGRFDQVFVGGPCRSAVKGAARTRGPVRQPVGRSPPRSPQGTGSWRHPRQSQEQRARYRVLGRQSGSPLGRLALAEGGPSSRLPGRDEGDRNHLVADPAGDTPGCKARNAVQREERCRKVREGSRGGRSVEPECPLVEGSRDRRRRTTRSMARREQL